MELTETFDIVRFRECELQHSRWAMLGLVGCVIGESSTGVSWADAGKVAIEQPSYLGFPINIPLSTIVAIEVLAMAFVEYNRGKGACGIPRFRPKAFLTEAAAVENNSNPAKSLGGLRLETNARVLRKLEALPRHTCRVFNSLHVSLIVCMRHAISPPRDARTPTRSANKEGPFLSV